MAFPQKSYLENDLGDRSKSSDGSESGKIEVRSFVGTIAWGRQGRNVLEKKRQRGQESRYDYKDMKGGRRKEKE